jgi:hypothetical protein
MAGPTSPARPAIGGGILVAVPLLPLINATTRQDTVRFE